MARKRKVRYCGPGSSTIQFECPVQWKRQVASIAALRGETLQSLCIKAISQYIEIPAPVEEWAAAEPTPEVALGVGMSIPTPVVDPQLRG